MKPGSHKAVDSHFKDEGSDLDDSVQKLEQELNTIVGAESIVGQDPKSTLG